MVSIPSPTIKCGLSEVPVLVFATKTIDSVPFPVAGADVKLKIISVLLWLPASEKILTTNIKGISQACVTRGSTVEAYIKKSNDDFGSGIGEWHKIATLTASLSSLTFAAESKIKPPVISAPPPKPICTPPQVYNDLTGKCEIKPPVISAPPPKPILSPIICTPPQVYNPSKGLCESPVIPPVIYTPPPITEVPGCSQIITTVDNGYPSHPSEITDFSAPFYIYIRGIKEACKDDISNPSFIKKVSKGTMGTITFGTLSHNISLTDDGVLDIDMSKLTNWYSGTPKEFTPPPVTIPTPVTIPQRPCPTGALNTRFRDAGTSLASVQAYLPIGYIAESASFGGAGTFKITRPNGTYFYAQSCSQIDSYLNWV